MTSIWQKQFFEKTIRVLTHFLKASHITEEQLKRLSAILIISLKHNAIVEAHFRGPFESIIFPGTRK